MNKAKIKKSSGILLNFFGGKAAEKNKIFFFRLVLKISIVLFKNYYTSDVHLFNTASTLNFSQNLSLY